MTDVLPGLPSLDYIRGRLSMLPMHADGCGCHGELQWLEPLLAEVERLRSPETALPNGRLTPAEERVFRYMRDTDLNVPDIADRLFVSTNTVKTHAKNVFRKLGVKSRLELRAVEVES